MELKEVMKLILKKYGGLYNFALTKLVYLIDVESVRRTGEQITNINWRKGVYGPFVHDIINCAEKNRDEFEVTYKEGFNGEKKLIDLKASATLKLETDIEALIDEVKNNAPNPNSDSSSFRDYIYETIPMKVCWSGSELNIKAAMKAEREVDELCFELDTQEWNEAFNYLAEH
ncbi:MAG: hypothetical protein BWK80_24715 [Desulfobacteraceae bacterium IS3]|nr:MAG: hypothetical protein BWK80_24715 [Desulfobacteraceae bacterium IS3]